MKVLMTTDAVGGVWQYSLDLARGLARHGVETILAVMGPRPSAAQRGDANSIGCVQLIESEFALEWMQDPWRDVDASIGWLQKLANDNDVDLVHLNGYAQAAGEFQRPVIVVAHSCVSTWWRAVHATAPGPEWADYCVRVQAGLRAANAVVAPTRAMANALRREYGPFEAPLRVIHNFSRAPRAGNTARRPVCLAAGRLWDKAKNLSVLDLAAREQSWPIQVAGPAADPQTGRAFETGLEVLGPLPHSEVLQRMREAALLLHPALYEPFGLSVLEAARSGCCLVLSDIDSLRELWDGAAVFVNPRDPEAWLHEVRRLAAELGERERFGGLALKRSAKYTALRTVGAYCDLYTSLRGKKRAGVAA